MTDKALETYRAKRDFRKTGEPMGEVGDKPSAGRRYLIQKHDATRVHFDLRLEHDGVLLSWAVPNGPSLDPQDKRLAVHVEDHPLEYGDFEGTIPQGNYGAGTVMLWDEGTWEPVGDPDMAFDKGDFKFVLHGERLKGKWVLVRIKSDRDRRNRRSRSKADNWLLIKERDRYATTEKKPIVERAITSVRTGRTMEEIAEGNVEWVESTFHFSEDKPAKKKRLAASSARRSSSNRNSPARSRRRRKATTGCTRSNSTATGRSPPSGAAGRGSSPAPGSTGATGSRRCSDRWPICLATPR